MLSNLLAQVRDSAVRGATGFANNQLRFDVQGWTLCVRVLNRYGQQQDCAFRDRFDRLSYNGQSGMEVPDYAPLAILSFPCEKFFANSRQIKMKRFRSGDEGLLR